MKVVAIIAEYNPFHNGHKYQIDKIKKEKDCFVISIMSSSFTQRGEPAILDKFTRSEIAVENGVDLVLELPTIYSTSNAEIFSKGAIYILDSLNIVDTLYFGSENNLYDLINIEKLINDNEEYISHNIKLQLDRGVSFLIARERAYSTFLTDEQINILKNPNNILAVEYLKALRYFNSKIKAKSILRNSVGHNSNHTSNSFASASYIRNLLLKSNLKLAKNFTPINLSNELSFNELNKYFDIFKYIILNNKTDFSTYFDYEYGLENRFFKYINSENIYDYIELVSSKRHTKSRISRLITQTLLDINIDLIKRSFTLPYIRILASNENGFKLIKKIKEKNFVIDKFSNINNLKSDNIIKEIALKEVFATNMYNIMINHQVNEDYFKNFTFIKK